MVDTELTPAAAAADIDALIVRGDVHELRAFHAGRPHACGCYDDLAQIVCETTTLAPHGVEMYATLNPVTDEFASRRPLNEARPARSGESAGDRDVARRKHLLVDIEPVRPSGTGTTDGQLADAERLADEVADDLASRGWPRPTRVCSGNGVHLRYRIDLPADDGGLVKNALSGLAYLHGDEKTKVDPSVHNAARLVRVPGAWNRKGDGGANHPHRMCRVTEVGSGDVVTAEQLEALAAEIPAAAPATVPVRKAPAASVGGPFRLDEFMIRHLPHAVGPEPYEGGRKWVLPVCPWNPEHTNRSACVIQRPGGVIQARCHHDSCSGNRWPELRALFDGRFAARKAQETRLQRLPPHIANEWRRSTRRK